MVAVAWGEHGRKLTEEEERKRDAAERCLWWWNLSMGVMHFVWAVICLGIGTSDTRAGKFRMQTITSFPDWSDRGPTADIQVRYLVRFTALTSGFAWLSAFAHFLVLILFPLYVHDLRRGINRFRWFEYAASSSLMIVLIAMLFGVWDAHLQLLVGSINACMNLFGYLHEVQNTAGKPVDWSNFAFGCFAGACPWAVIFSYTGSVNRADVPGFVWAILAFYIFFFNTFPVNMVLQYAQVGPWYQDERGGFPGAGYYFGEKIYQVLSLLSKSLLLWLVVGGTNQPSAVSSR